MTKLADAIHFDYIEELCDEVLNRLETDEDTWVSVVGKYDDIRAFIKDLLTYDDVNFDCLDICNPKCNDYTSEYVVDIWTCDGKVIFDCEPAKVDDEYDYYKGDVLYMLEETKQSLADNCEYDEKYFVIIGEDECDCDECECCCEDKSSKDDWVINVTCNLDTKEANKLIDEMEQKLIRVNDIFKEMNTMKSFFGW